MNAIGACGLQLYNFGQTVSMVFFTDNWRPASFYDRVKENRDIGLHTLMLLDIKVKEQSLENMARGRKIYEPPRYASARSFLKERGLTGQVYDCGPMCTTDVGDRRGEERGRYGCL